MGTKPARVFVEGNLCSGKSTLCRALGATRASSRCLARECALSTRAELGELKAQLARLFTPGIYVNEGSPVTTLAVNCETKLVHCLLEVLGWMKDMYALTFVFLEATPAVCHTRYLLRNTRGGHAVTLDHVEEYHRGLGRLKQLLRLMDIPFVSVRQGTHVCEVKARIAEARERQQTRAPGPGNECAEGIRVDWSVFLLLFTEVELNEDLCDVVDMVCKYFEGDVK